MRNSKSTAKAEMAPKTKKAEKLSLHIPDIAEPSEQERFKMIAEAAYYNAELRDFKDGDPDLDWYLAEEQIDQQLLNREV